MSGHTPPPKPAQPNPVIAHLEKWIAATLPRGAGLYTLHRTKANGGVGPMKTEFPLDALELQDGKKGLSPSLLAQAIWDDAAYDAGVLKVPQVYVVLALKDERDPEQTSFEIDPAAEQDTDLTFPPNEQGLLSMVLRQQAFMMRHMRLMAEDNRQVAMGAVHQYAEDNRLLRTERSEVLKERGQLIKEDTERQVALAREQANLTRGNMAFRAGIEVIGQIITAVAARKGFAIGGQAPAGPGQPPPGGSPGHGSNGVDDPFAAAKAAYAAQAAATQISLPGVIKAEADKPNGASQVSPTDATTTIKISELQMMQAELAQMQKHVEDVTAQNKKLIEDLATRESSAVDDDDPIEPRRRVRSKQRN